MLLSQVPMQRMVEQEYTVMVPRVRMVPVKEMVPQVRKKMIHLVIYFHLRCLLLVLRFKEHVCTFSCQFNFNDFTLMLSIQPYAPLRL